MFFDAHCHLNDFNNPELAVRKAGAENVHGIISNSVDLESMKANLSLSSAFDSVKCALGVHPSNLLSMNKGEISSALGFLEKNLESAVAVGEIGLDFKHANTTGKKKKQADYFKAQIEIAERFDKPVIVHSRLAVSEAIKLLSGHECRILFHWFSGTTKELEKAIDLGSFFSVGPAIEFNPGIRLIAERIPQDRLLSETDAPVPFKGKASEPCWIPRVVMEIARARGENLEKVEKNIEKNFNDFIHPKSRR